MKYLTENDIKDELEYFHPYFYMDVIKPEDKEPVGFINLKIHLDDLYGEGLGFDAISEQWSENYFNDGFSNLAFTKVDDFNTVFKYEYYKGMFFIRLDEYVDRIAIHVFPKNYYTMNQLLLLKEDYNDFTYELKPNATYYTRDNYDKEPYDRVNATYMMEEDDSFVIRKGRNTYKDFSKFKKQNGMYHEKSENGWIREDYKDNFVEYDYPLGAARTLSSIEIASGYTYNESCSNNIEHYIGIKDKTNASDEDRAAIIAMNPDNINNILPDETNYSTIPQQYWDDSKKQTQLSETYNVYKDEKGLSNPHTINKRYDMTLKYLNDDLYIEENNQYLLTEWEDPSL